MSHNNPILITPERGRKEVGKGNSSKEDDTKVFMTLGHSNWTVCNLLNGFCPKIFPPFYQGLP